MQLGQNFTQLTDLDPILSELFYQHYEDLPEYRGALFRVIQSEKAKETDLRVGGFSDPEDLRSGAGTVTYDTAERGHEIDYRHTLFAQGFQIRLEDLEDLQYDGIFQNASDLAVVMRRKMEKDAADFLNNAFDSGFPIYDGQPLCSASHPRSRTDSETVSNYVGAKALTAANLDAAMVQLEELGDDIGELTNAMANLVIVGRAQRKKAVELLLSDREAESANNATNFFNVGADMNLLIHPRIKGNKWFVADSTMVQRYMKWYDRRPVTFSAMDDFDREVRKYKATMRYSYGASDFRQIVGSNPS
ncbi:MAG: hypothetical protein AAF787_00210 [Chloroflexota bacterium]